MCHDEKKNSLYELCLRTNYDGILPSFKKLLQKYGASSINNRNLETLATEIYTVSKDPSPIMTEFFKPRENISDILPNLLHCQ